MGAALLLHGFASDNRDFARLLPFLSARYQKVYCPNLPQHGPGQLKSKLNAKEIVAFAERAFDELKEQYGSVDVFGFSMGGALASYIASVRDVNRLIALAPANKYLMPGIPFAQMKYTAEWRGAQKKLKNGIVCDAPAGISTMDEIKKDNKEAMRWFMKELLPRYTVANIAEFAKVIKYCNKGMRANTINAPALIIWGRFDQFVPESSVKHLIAHCRNANTQTVIYADISHIMLNSCAYLRIIDDVLSFLDKTDAPALTYTKGLT